MDGVTTTSPGCRATAYPPRARRGIPLTDPALAKRRLTQLAAGLERAHPGAAASLREGLDETLTLQSLGVTGTLYRTLRSTNAIGESQWSGRPVHPQRAPLARRAHARALDRRWPARERTPLPPHSRARRSPRAHPRARSLRARHQKGGRAAANRRSRRSGRFNSERDIPPTARLHTPPAGLE